MKKKYKAIIVTTLLMLMTISLSGCTTPGKDFDTVKIVATVTRNGGDYTLEPSGGSGYTLAVVIGTLSISALGQDIDQQEIKTMYKNSYDQHSAMQKELYSGSSWWSKVKRWYENYQAGGMNTVKDLTLATGVGDAIIDLPNFDCLGQYTTSGSFADTFGVNTSLTNSIPSFGLGIYMAQIPAEKFPNGIVEPGYVVVTNPLDNKHPTGVTVTPAGENAGFVYYDGSNYQVVVLSNTPAFATSTRKTLHAQCSLVKPDLPQGATNLYNSQSKFYDVYAEHLSMQLNDVSTGLEAQLATVLNTATNRVYTSLPGGGFLKTFDDISNLISGNDNSATSIETKGREAKVKSVIQGKDVYKTAYSYIYDNLNGRWAKQSWEILGHTIDLDDGGDDLNKDAEYIVFILEEKLMKDRDWLVGGYTWTYFNSLINEDWEVYLNSHDIGHWYDIAMAGDVVNFNDDVCSIQIIGDDGNFLGITGPSMTEAWEELLGLHESMYDVSVDDLENMTDDLKTEIKAVMQEIIPEAVANAISDAFGEFNQTIADMNAYLYDVTVILNQMTAQINALIPTVPTIEIFPYETPTATFTKILKESGDFLQADPTSSFNAACLVSKNDSWTFVSGYPRAIIKTQSHGTLTVPLHEDTDTGAWILRRDMVGVDNLTVGDTVKTYFEAKVTNGTVEKLDRSNAYYTRVQRHWLDEALDALGLVIDDLTNTTDDLLNESQNWLSQDDNPWLGGNISSLEPFYAVLDARDEDGNALYVKGQRKAFMMKQNDSETLIWEVTIFENEPYTLSISVGNATMDGIVTYKTSINENEMSSWNPYSWGTRIREYFTKD